MRIFLFFILLFFVNTNTAQPIQLDEERYMILDELNALLATIKTAPIVNEGCTELPCDAVNVYYNALFNFREDVSRYYQALEASKNISQDQWFLYLDQTYRNENLKWALITNLRFKEAWAGASSFLLDLSSGAQVFKAGNHITKKGIAGFLQAIDDFDGFLSQINALMKHGTNDSGTSVISATLSDDWSNVYTSLKASLDLIVKGVELYKKVDASLSGSELKKARVSRGLAITAAVAQLLNVYSSYERKGMKDAIKELDKVLGPNQSTQSLHYDKYITKRKLLDVLDKIIQEIGFRYEGIFDLNLRCKGKVQRAVRPSIVIDKREYGTALQVYKKILLQTNTIMANAWKNIKECAPEKRKYQFVVNNGLGKKRSAFIEVLRVSDGKQLYRGSTSSKASILSLYPDAYTFEIYEGHTLDGIMSPATTISDFKLNSAVDTIINFNPFGRIALKVTDKAGTPQNFRYTFKNKAGKIVAYAMTSSSKTVKRDLLAETYNLELSYNYDSKRELKQNITILPNQLNTLHFVYDEGRFTQEKNAVTETTSTSHLPTKEFIPTPPKTAPENWISGTVYNTTNGSCNWKNSTLIFRSHRGTFLDLKTNKVVKEVHVLPGQNAEIAVREDEANFLRVFRVTSDGEERISFWLIENPNYGWWYAVGCDDGFGPPNACNDGKGNTACRFLPN